MSAGASSARTTSRSVIDWPGDHPPIDFRKAERQDSPYTQTQDLEIRGIATMQRKKMSRRRIMTGATGLAAATILRWPASAAEYSWKYGSVLPITHPMNARIAEAAPKIKEATGGRFEYTVYASSALGGDTAMIAQTISGALQMYSLSGDILAPRNPAGGIMSVGFAFPGYGQNWAAMDGELGLWYRSLAEKQGLFALEKAFDHGFRNITSRNKPINTPDDLHGMKIRLPVAPTLIALFKSLGASPTALNFGEVYSALQTGVVDGQENPLQLIDEAKFYEVQKYVSMTGHVWAGLHCSFNLAAWKKLPPDLQDIIGQHMTEAATLQRADWIRNNETVSKTLQEHGMIFNTPDITPFRALASKNGFYSETKKRMGDEPWTLLEKYTGPLT
jgi:tripartite ATP-independent transporter DctP family solute receptor